MEALDMIKEGIFLLDFELDESKEDDIVRREIRPTGEHCNSKAWDVLEDAYEVSNKGLPGTQLGTLIFSNHPLECMVGPDRSTSLPGQSLLEIFAAGPRHCKCADKCEIH